MAETLSERVAALEMWKESAMQVLAEYDAAWEAAGKPGPLGGSKARALRDYAIAAESREKQARVEGAREAAETLIEFVRTWRGFDVDVAGDCGPSTGNVLLREMRKFRDREYPATGEEPTQCADVVGCDGKCCVRPAPPAVTEPPMVQLTLAVWNGVESRNVEVDITPEDARAIVVLASRPTASGEG